MAIFYGALLASGILIAGLAHHPYINNTILYGMRLRVALAGLVYREVFIKCCFFFFPKIYLIITLFLLFETFKLKHCALSSENGMLVNLLSSDASRLNDFFVFLPYFVIAPLQCAFVVYIMIKKIGFSFLAGLLILFLFIPIQSILGKLFSCAK